MHSDTATRCLAVLSRVLLMEGELEKVAAGGALFDSASLDSLALVNLVVDLENEFFVQIDAENLDQVFACLASLTAYLDGKRVG